MISYFCCGLLNNCNENGFVCNCDCSKSGCREDVCMITNMISLPVTRFKYKNLEDQNQRESVQIGRLTCKGRKEMMKPQKLSESNNFLNIRLRYESSGVFGKYSVNRTKVTLCNMEKLMDGLFTEEEFEEFPLMKPNNSMSSNEVM
jgi:hypothetical protein